ncbi:hypothetical protein [Streptomyces sp. NPDC048057]|uniref:hypothetical protein n=1 Tax=Streptomyces sp. NPDC048057 TaxID=3155628 RepID=UPI0033C83C6F
MTDGQYLRRYGTDRGFALGFFVPAFTLLMGAAGAVVLDDVVPAWVSVAVVAVLVLLAVWVAAAVLRAVTIVRQEHLVIRTAFRTRRIAWGDVQGIQIERIPNAAQHDLPERTVVVYDRDGRRLGLPHLNDREVAELDAEASALRDLWQGWRGPGWAPVPNVAGKMSATAAKASEHALTPGTLAAFAGGCSAWFALMVFLVVGLNTDLLDGIPEDLLVYLLVGPLPVVGLVVYVTTVLRRRRRRCRRR